jgi:hypothetical protein
MEGILSALQAKQISQADAQAKLAALSSAPKGGNTVSATIEGKELVIRVPMNPTPRLSSTGKTRLVATASGKTDLYVEGKQIKLTVSAYVPV